MTTAAQSRGPLRVAIVGAGPSGFFAAEALLRSNTPVEVTMIDRLPSPHGLVRAGVAPDHPKLKQATLVFEKIAQLEGFRFFGNVEIGRTIGIDDLRQTHHAVILSYGASEDQRIGVAGEDLANSHSAREFVGWYNGHPDYRDRRFDLSGEVAVIIGQGNVALDVARILSKPVDELRKTDIASHAMEVLAESRLREIYIVGRRGPAQAKFTSPELREFGTLAGCSATVVSEELELNEASRVEATDRMSRTIATNLEILSTFDNAGDNAKAKRCHFRFFLAPQVILGDTQVRAIQFARTALSGPAFDQKATVTDESWTLPCQFVLRSVGYRGVAVEGVPFEPRRGLVPHAEGRVVDLDGKVVPGLYAAGWIKRGPTGIIGTNRACGVATVETLLSDADRLGTDAKPGAEGLQQLLEKRGAHPTTFGDWRQIDRVEIERGERLGKPREKFTRVEEMLDLCKAAAE
ncbi:FAD/NAD(P)-binding protein (plasmid) [Rhizobium sp. CB3090]|uniref:FAD/NAD(P)-binding protein n=1 Tax=Rhizobium sp. CB3090 TaxID=3039156 RepID=UPI0024B0B52A|nr:FAD/NAD(P)-binding protein [Rhizobium sp. CB3090]WFU12886.1 FAD/NAD(P)-binding protein [Rhizobium sp. CB3090]